MEKLINKNNNKLINYQNFLKNNNLKKNQYKNILFENFILINENNLISSFNLNKIIYTIKTEYNKHLLLNYKLNYDIIYNFSKIMFNIYIKKNKEIIKARIINGNQKKFLISLFGILIKIKLKNILHKSLLYRKKSKLNKKNLITYYKLKKLNFKLDFYKKSILSRKAYVREIIKKKKNATI
jgi:hypothetical protein